MRKIFLLMLAFMATWSVFAQENLATGATATASSEDGPASAAIDGNTDTRWSSVWNQGDDPLPDEQRKNQWLLLTWDEEQTFNTINLDWETAYASGFEVQTSANGEDFETVKSITDNSVAISGGHGNQTVQLDEAVTTKYLRLKFTDTATTYGYSLYEVNVYYASEESYQLETFEVGNVFIATNTRTNLNAVVRDKLGNDLTEGVTFSVSPENAVLEYTDGALFLTAEATGSYTITATQGEVSKQAEVSAVPAPEAASDVFAAIYTGDVNTVWGTIYNNGAVELGEVELDGIKAKPFKAANCVFFTNTALWGDIYNVNINPTESQYGKLHISIFAATDAQGRVVLEQTRAIGDEHAFTLKANEWTEVEVDLEGETFIKAMSVRMNNGEDIILSNIYFKQAAADEHADEVATLEAGVGFVQLGVDTNLNLVAKNAKGVTVENVTYTVEEEGATISEDGTSFIATEGTSFTIVAHGANETSASTTVNVLPAKPQPTADIENVLAIYSDAYGATTYDPSNAAWNGGFGTQGEIAIAEGDNAIHVTEDVCFGVNAGGKDITDFTELHVTIYSKNDFDGRIQIEGTQMANLPISLKAGEWNEITVALTGDRTNATWIQMYVGNAESKNDVIIDDIYFSKLAEGELSISEPDAQGIVTVMGKITNDNKDQVEAVTAAAIDLSGATFADDVTSLAPANKNAMLIVAGEIEAGQTAVSSDIAEQLAGTDNLIVKRNDGYYFPVNQLVITDENASQPWTGFFVSANTLGYQYSRTIKAGAVVTAYLPVAITEQVEGISVYEFTGYDSETNELTLTLKEDGIIAAHTPYILKNTAEQDITITGEGTGDFDVRAVDPATNVEADGIIFQGNYVAFAGTGAEYAMQNNELGRFDGAVIGAFRAYFTGIPENASVKFDDHDSTGISVVGSEKAGDGFTYNLAGQVVGREYKGIIIRNGKKYLQK